MAFTRLDPARLARAKVGDTVRTVPRALLANLTVGARVPRPGDLLLARVERLGRDDGLDRPGGLHDPLAPGDEILVAYGVRPAADGGEAEIPADLGACHLIASEGLAARLRPGARARATEISPIGLLADFDGRPVNLADWPVP